MKRFENPEIEIEKFEFSDVITTSCTDDGGQACDTQLPCYDD